MTVVRPASPEDLPAVAAFVAQLNAVPASQSLHLAADAPGAVRRALADKENFPDGWAGSFVLGVAQDGTIVGAFGAQLDVDRALAWLWGPWLGDNRLWSTLAPDLFAGLVARLPKSVRQVDAFLHADNRPGLRALQALGFSPGPTTHIYVVPRARWMPPQDAVSYPTLRPAHEVAFARLHTDTFPAQSSTPARALLDGRDGEHAIFAATDGLRLLGTVCVSVNRAPSEGFVDYLAVKPAARGRGVGSGLLHTAMHWTFETQRLPQAALCVSNWREGARRLYEQAGFTLQASGVAMRRRL